MRFDNKTFFKPRRKIPKGPRKPLWTRKHQRKSLPRSIDPNIIIWPSKERTQAYIYTINLSKQFNFYKNCLLNWALYLRLLRYCRCTIKHESNNLYVNIAYLHGPILKEFHSGLYYNNSMRRSNFSVGLVLRHVHQYLYRNTYKFSGMILNIKGISSYSRLHKEIKLIFFVRITFFKINLFSSEAHNGIRLKKKRRK